MALTPQEEFNNNMALARDSVRRAERQIGRAMEAAKDAALEEVFRLPDGRVRSRHPRGNVRLKSARGRVKALLRELSRYEWPGESGYGAS